MTMFWKFCLSAILAPVLAVPPFQVPLQSPANNQQYTAIQEHTDKKRPLYGRFLHVTGVLVLTKILSLFTNKNQIFIQTVSTKCIRPQPKMMHVIEGRDQPGSMAQSPAIVTVRLSW